MKLSLSVRVAESFSNKRVMDINLPELASMATTAGFEALCMRASAVGVHSSPGQVADVSHRVKSLGLAVSMITGDFAVPENSEEGPACLRHITPFLDLAEALGSDLIRVCIKQEGDLPFAQRAADEAAERGIRLAHQSHTRSLFETVDGSLDVLKRINRSNFGLIYEPANLAICGQDYGIETLKSFSPYLFNVYVQNHTPDPMGNMPMQTWVQGEVMTTLRPLDAAGGIDWGRMVEGLQAVDYTGYLTSHQALVPGAEPLDAIARYASFLRGLIS